MGYRHIVLFHIAGHVKDEQVVEAISLLRALGDLSGVQQWRVEESLDRRKGRLIVENGLFTDSASYQAFRDDSRHAAAAAFLGSIADWWVGDYEE